MLDEKVPDGSAYRQDIDGLRALAVLSVLFYHTDMPGFSGGFVGVDIFFVISGYLITRIIWQELLIGQFSLTDFYARRVKRIFPALYAVLILSSIAAFVLLIPSDLIAYGQSLDATALFYSNFHFLKQVGYFDGPAIDKPLLHTWSLAVEEQFYAVWPLLLVLIMRFLPRRRVLLAVIGLAAASFLLAEIRLFSGYQKDAFYLAYYRGWELLVGAALALAPIRVAIGKCAELASLAGLAAIAFSVTLFDAYTPFPGLSATLPCAGAALIIAAARPSTATFRLLSLGPIRLVGLISYSLYLIHWPLLSFAHLYLNDILSLHHRLLLVVVSILAAYFSWRFIETPIRKLREPGKLILLAAVPAVCVIYSTGLFFWLKNGLPWRVNENVLAAEAALEQDNKHTQFCRPSRIAEIRAGSSCELGDLSRSNVDFVIWGDSHAAHYAMAVDPIARQRGARGVLFARGGCAPFVNDAYIAEPCRNFNTTVMRWIKRQENLRTVLLASRWNSNQRSLKSALRKVSRGENAGGLAETLAGLNQLHLVTVVLEQVLDFNQSVPLCIARALKYGREVSSCAEEPQERVLSRRKLVNEYFDSLKGHYEFSRISTLPAFCDGKICYALHNGEPLLRDGNHLSMAGARHIMPYLNIPGLSAPIHASKPDITHKAYGMAGQYGAAVSSP